MTDENERSRIVAILRDLTPEIVERVAEHKILAEFRDETRVKLKELNKEVGQLSRGFDGVKRDARDLHGRISGQEAITNGQRVRLETAERAYASISEAVGRVQERQERNSERIGSLERQESRYDRLSELERMARDKPAASAQPAWTDIPIKILLGAILIGMALGKAGFDPSAWFQ